MNERLPRFRYRLAALLRRGEWECEVLRGELGRARVALEESQRRHDEVLTDIGRAEDMVRDLYRRDTSIAVDARERLQAYLDERRQQAEERHRQVERAESRRETVQRQLESARVALRGLEKHRDRARAAYEWEQGVRVEQVADELWLLRSRESSRED
jgi:hypothetical protein